MQKNKFTEVCHICGMPLTKFQIGLRVNIYGQNYVERIEAEGDLVVCLECYEKIKVNYTGGMKKAMKKYQESMKNDQSM